MDQVENFYRSRAITKKPCMTSYFNAKNINILKELFSGKTVQVRSLVKRNLYTKRNIYYRNLFHVAMVMLNSKQQQPLNLLT